MVAIVVYTSNCSDISSASSISMPKYRRDADLQQIAGPELAIYRQIEQRHVSKVLFALQAHSD